MARVTVNDLAAILEDLKGQIAEMSVRLEALEAGKRGTQPVNGVAAASVPPPIAAPVPVAAATPVAAAISEEELLAIAAAIGAYLGVRARIKQIRLISTSAWAQQGRVSIQASHRLQ